MPVEDIDFLGCTPEQKEVQQIADMLGTEMIGRDMYGEVVGHAKPRLDPNALHGPPPPNPPGELFRIMIRAPRLIGEGREVPYTVIGDLYRQAVVAEMSDSLRNAVTVSVWSVRDGDKEEKFIRDLSARATVEVQLGSAVKGMGFGSVTNQAMSYMFQLRDDVLAVIDNFEPPEGAWVADEEPQTTGDRSMVDVITNDAAASVAEATTATALMAPAAPSALTEVNAALKFVNEFLPGALVGLSAFAPAEAPIIATIQPVFGVLVKAVNTVATDTGKPWEEVLIDVINHLTPGAPAAPSLN